MENYNVELRESSNYDMFEFHPQNRGIKKSKVAILCDEIMRKNLLHHFPVVVKRNNRILSTKYIILDGQHRFEACKKLDIPVIYRIVEDMDYEDVSYINSVSHNWSAKDFVNYYAKQNNEHYQKLQSIIDLGFDVRSATILCGNDMVSSTSTKFRTGKWKVKSSNKQINELLETFLYLKTNCDIAYAYSQRFVRSTLYLIYAKKADISRFKDQILKYKQKVHKCTNREEYNAMLIAVYNFNLQEKYRI
tara:strand:+ start:229 stop:972 length:744 start_codon:yes stop_codon:yes gene_type:complete